MNKKILPIFVMVMALSLLGISCNNKSTDPNKTEETLKDMPAFTALKGTATGSPVTLTVASANTAPSAETGVFDNSNVKGLAGIKYTVTAVIDDPDEAGGEAPITLTTDSFTTTDGTDLNLTTEGAKLVSALSAQNDYEQVKVTVTVSATGYKSSSVTIFVKAVRGHA